jgi:hypothetical protein
MFQARSVHESSPGTLPLRRRQSLGSHKKGAGGRRSGVSVSALACCGSHWWDFADICSWTHSAKSSVPPRESKEWKTAETPQLSQKKRGSSESCRTFMRRLTYAAAHENVGSGWVPLRPPQVGFLGYTDQPEDSPYGVIRSKFVSCAIGVVGR